MDELMDALRYVLPSVVVFLTAYLLLREFFRMETNRRRMEALSERVRISLPLRLQAYERIVLLLERISAGNLLPRLYQPELTAAEFQRLLVQAVRDEYNHNLSQQLYVSRQAWDLVKSAREEVIRQINTASAQVDSQASAADLSNKMLEFSVEKSATGRALDFLKAEAAKVF